MKRILVLSMLFASTLFGARERNQKSISVFLKTIPFVKTEINKKGSLEVENNRDVTLSISKEGSTLSEEVHVKGSEFPSKVTEVELRKIIERMDGVAGDVIVITVMPSRVP